ncbi:HTH domain-containing protein [Cellulosilyticum sp. WCF-2]|uniref:HTH domain-containing protein n=1 Tax=Cellulosilyticum sp. WCF-2 TaxID=2497860 RepID=UPI000F8F1EB9|nr:HTH domain-containing protein [Cellulosilyticum sp. WCF-2]QEH70514.1 HTH domain-containing protein [Cellulosilyticum sp. WCF-2]
MSQVIQEAKRFYTAQDVANLLGVSTTTAYRTIKQLNDGLKAQGFIIVPGKISVRYFNEKVYI